MAMDAGALRMVPLMKGSGQAGCTMELASSEIPWTGHNMRVNGGMGLNTGQVPLFCILQASFYRLSFQCAMPGQWNGWKGGDKAEYHGQWRDGLKVGGILLPSIFALTPGRV